MSGEDCCPPTVFSPNSHVPDLGEAELGDRCVEALLSGIGLNDLARESRLAHVFNLVRYHHHIKIVPQFELNVND